MWYPATVTIAADELVTIGQARQQARTDIDADFDAELTRDIAAARNHVEAYCGIRIGSQTVVAKCDAFEDMARVEEVPLVSVTSIQYVDTDGATQTLSTSVYEVRSDDLEASIVLKYAQSWPAIQPGSRITLTAVVGYAAAPPAVLHAMLLRIADFFKDHEAMASEDFTTFDALLANHRRGV